MRIVDAVFNSANSGTPSNDPLYKLSVSYPAADSVDALDHLPTVFCEEVLI